MNRTEYVQACVELLHTEVSTKKGFSGFAIQSAYKSLCVLKPNAAYKAVDFLFDDFWSVYQQKGSNPKILSEALLEITDQKALPFQKNPLFKIYKMLRPSAQPHVEAALPKLTQLLDKLGTNGTSTKFK